ncbi:MAG: FecR domain-containing protein, partial [Acidobacteriia bacterium]|nr:FecR domain-containing protein [Terriglobia bacterium]
MSLEDTPIDPTLESAISQIRAEPIPDAVVDAAAERVWQRLTAEMEQPGSRIPDCAGFQTLFPDLRTGRLSEARALLVRDHLRECVVCRHAFDPQVLRVPNPSRDVNHLSRDRQGAIRTRALPRYAIAASIVIAAGGLAVWFAVFQPGSASSRAVVRSIDGTLYEVSTAGLRVMNAGEALPDGVEIRTAGDSRATVLLRDGSVAEMRERSDLSTSSAGQETTLHLDRGSVIVQAAHRSSGHLYIATADCRVAVTGTLFSVSAGVKGSRVSVVEGQVNVSRDNHQTVLHPGDHWETSETLEPLPVREDLGWSHNARLAKALAALRNSLGQVQVSHVRYESHLLEQLPASTVFYASIPNLSGYFAQAENVFRRKSAENEELRNWLAGPGASIEPLVENLRATNEYLGDEIVVFGTAASPAPVVLAEMKREGLAEFLRQAGLPLSMEVRGRMVMLSPNPRALAIPLDSTFQKTPFYQQIAEAYRQGAGMLMCVDLTQAPHPQLPDGRQPPVTGAHYLIAEQNRAGEHMETRAALAFDSSRQGMAAWLAPPAPNGAMEYITPDATLVLAFTAADVKAVLDQVAEAVATPSTDPRRAEIRRQIAATLGGEFAVALDGPPLPVPSWKLVVEVNNPERFEAALENWVAAYNQAAAAKNEVTLRTARETTDGHTWYTLGWGAPNPLSEAHYTFASGYLIAAPTRVLVTRALETSANGTGLARSQSFTALLPRDPYTDFSALVYQNLGTSLAPLAGLLGPKSADLTHWKPLLVTAYGAPGRISLASTGDLLGVSLNNFLTGSVFG